MMAEGTETAEAIAYAAEESGNVDDSGNFSIEVGQHVQPILHACCCSCWGVGFFECVCTYGKCTAVARALSSCVGVEAGREAVPRPGHHARVHRPSSHGGRVVRGCVRSYSANRVPGNEFRTLSISRHA